MSVKPWQICPCWINKTDQVVHRSSVWYLESWIRDGGIKWFHLRLLCHLLFLPLLSLPANYNGLPNQTWILRSLSSLIVYFKTETVTLITKPSAIWLDCPHQAPLEIWRCKTAANWEQSPFYCCLLIYTWKLFHWARKPNVCHGTAITHFNYCIYFVYIMLWPIQKQKSRQFFHIGPSTLFDCGFNLI